MDHHAYRFVHHDEIVIVIEDLERQGFGGRGVRCRQRHGGFHDKPGGDCEARFGRTATSRYETFTDQVLDVRARQLREMMRQKHVQTRAGLVGADGESVAPADCLFPVRAHGPLVLGTVMI
jgi:hypothetical protein